MPAPFPISKSLRVGEDFAVLTAGAYADLTAISGKPARCPRRVQTFATTNISVLRNSKGVDAPPGSVPAGTLIDADVSAITVDATVMVFW